MRERYRREGGLSSLILQNFCVGAILVRRESRQLAKPGLSTSLRRFFALSAAIALNIRLRVCLTVATPFDRMACKVKSWLSQVRELSS
jgi:hypothetical protein